MGLKTLIMNPWVSLGWGYLGVIIHISSMYTSESPWGITEWIKGNQKTFATTILSWLVVWAVWSSGTLGSFFPATMGPICVFLGIGANSLFDHIAGQIEEGQKRKNITV